MVNNQNIDKIIFYFHNYGEKNYIGEQITQKKHMINAAFLAKEKCYSYNLICASLLHDIGHLLLDYPEMFDDKNKSLGVKDHEKVGAQFLRLLNFNEDVCRLVELHVDAKRYLISKNNYNISKASMETLKHQGGLMTTRELQIFEDDPLFKDAILLRYLDDESKNVDANIEIEYFIETMNKCMNLL